ncbi:MAG: competence/damage-inducible protein A [Candidatus Aminicenantes bacterium]|nr:competence/damage-inducible protein A [Candidatus Aminicenantes bacterium]
MAKTIRVEIIAVGSELLSPHYLDTNSLYLTRIMNELGLPVVRKTIVGDDAASLSGCFRDALKRADLILVSGGLGPTEDDRTREVWARVLNRPLVFQPAVYERIRRRFRRRGLTPTTSNRKQAYVLKGARILPNKNGTAPGLWIEATGRTVILLPGPPAELKPMVQDLVWPRLQRRRRGFYVRRVLKLTGLGESVLENEIVDLYPKDAALSVTTLASPGQLEIHIYGWSDKGRSALAGKAHRLEKAFAERLGDFIFSRNEESLEEVVADLLASRGKTVATAESCSGGLLSHRLTNVPGSSAFFLEGVVAYADQAKTERLGVPAPLIHQYGAVSAHVARAMAESVRRRSRAHFGLAVTGIAGPGGRTPTKPVGLVYTALAWDNGTQIEKNLFPGARDAVKFQSSQKALDMLRRHLLLARAKPARPPRNRARRTLKGHRP